MRKISLLLAIGGMVLSLLVPTTSAWAASPQTTRADTPPPGEVTLDLKGVNGSGCPKGTTDVTVAGDKTAFTVTYQKYQAQVGPDAKPIETRVFCQLAMVAHIPQGFTYAIASADYRGFAHLAPGAHGLEKNSYYFQGQPKTADREHPIAGAEFETDLGDNWQFTDTTDVADLVWEPCGKNVNVNVKTELRVAAGTSDPGSTSIINMDSTDFAFSTVFQIAWKECKP